MECVCIYLLAWLGFPFNVVQRALKVSNVEGSSFHAAFNGTEIVDALTRRSRSSSSTIDVLCLSARLSPTLHGWAADAVASAVSSSLFHSSLPSFASQPVPFIPPASRLTVTMNDSTLFSTASRDSASCRTCVRAQYRRDTEHGSIDHLVFASVGHPSSPPSERSLLGCSSWVRLTIPVRQYGYASARGVVGNQPAATSNVIAPVGALERVSLIYRTADRFPGCGVSRDDASSYAPTSVEPTAMCTPSQCAPFKPKAGPLSISSACACWTHCWPRGPQQRPQSLS